jgi:predicted acetyltransferase
MRDIDQRLHDAPVHDAARAAIEAQGLDVRRIDDTARADTDPWLDAVARGFLDGERNDTHREAFLARVAGRRMLGVYDPGAPVATTPVSTFASWGSELTVPGGIVPASAISAVTVAPTHRRRGILREVMAGELRTAAELGYAAAVLTVSESGIYGRFGFGPAAPAAHWRLDVRRAGWRGPEPDGRIDFLTREQGREIAGELHDRVRPGSPGEIEMPRGHWDRFFGTSADAEKGGELRVLQYRSVAGQVDGLAIYRVTENHDDFPASTVDVSLLLAATDDAYAALWRFLLSMDLIGTIRAGELSVEEPLWWMIADQRAATITIRDHQYVRILDVAAALSGRRYDTADVIALEVEDPLGIAGGRFTLSTDAAGAATVEAGAADGGALSVRLGVAELSAILLGGVSPATLARAGRVHTDDPARLARVFATPTAPRLSFWY